MAFFCFHFRLWLNNDLPLLHRNGVIAVFLFNCLIYVVVVEINIGGGGWLFRNCKFIVSVLVLKHLIMLMLVHGEVQEWWCRSSHLLHLLTLPLPPPFGLRRFKIFICIAVVKITVVYIICVDIVGIFVLIEVKLPPIPIPIAVLELGLFLFGAAIVNIDVVFAPEKYMHLLIIIVQDAPIVATDEPFLTYILYQLV